MKLLLPQWCSSMAAHNEENDPVSGLNVGNAKKQMARLKGLFTEDGPGEMMGGKATTLLMRSFHLLQRSLTKASVLRKGAT